MLLSLHQNTGQNLDIKIANRPLEKCDTAQIFGNDSNISKFDSGENKEEIEFWYSLLSFGPEPSGGDFVVDLGMDVTILTLIS
jgi:hypothetical protein